MSKERSPLSDRVLVKPDTKEKNEHYESGDDKPNSGIAVLVGRGKNGVAMEVEQGDHILFNKGAGIEITLDGEDYLIIEESRILMFL